MSGFCETDKRVCSTRGPYYSQKEKNHLRRQVLHCFYGSFADIRRFIPNREGVDLQASFSLLESPNYFSIKATEKAQCKRN